jgi:photosystem II stability/assembly factor-like uncharacterized protein
MIRCRLPHALAVLALACLVPGAASAGINTWTSNGPASPFVRALVIDPATPTTLYAGTEGGGVYRTDDGGALWNAVNDDDLVSENVLALAIDPATPATLYAGTNDAGVFKTLDGGTTWDPVNTGLTTLSILSLAVDPTTPATVYAGTNGGGIFKSVDGGANWAPNNTGLGATTVNAIAINPTNSVIYLGTDDGVAKSVDGGGSWTSTALVATVLSVAVDATAPNTVYAGTLFLGAFKSTTGGSGAWTAINTGITAVTVRTLAIDPSMATTLYAGTPDAGVFTSLDAGLQWSALNNGLTHGNVPVLAVDPSNHFQIHAGTLGGGVFHHEVARCDDNGEPLDCGFCQTCDPDYGCIGEPTNGCHEPFVPGKARLRFKNDAIGARDRIVWAWGRGSNTTTGQFGTPTTTTDYEVCIFDESGEVPRVEMRGRIPAAGICKRGKPCWKATKQGGFKYRNGDGLPDGLTKLILKPGGNGKAKVVLKGRGVDLNPPDVPINLPFRLQLRNEIGQCWEATYDEAGTVRNFDRRYNGKSAP